MNNQRLLVLFAFLDFLRGCKVSCRPLRKAERHIRVGKFSMRRSRCVSSLPEAKGNKEVISPTLIHSVFSCQEMVQ